MSTCSHCELDVAGSAEVCPRCGATGEDWKRRPYVPPSPTSEAWFSLIGTPLLLLFFIPAVIYAVVRIGVPILVGVAAFLFSNLSRVNWDAVDTFSLWAARLAAILWVPFVIKRSDVREYFKKFPDNTALVLKRIAIFVAVIGALYLLYKVAGHAFLR